MSKTPEEIMNEIAKEQNFRSWTTMVEHNMVSDVDIIGVTERYAQFQTQELSDWKESASKVFKNLDLQTLGKTLGIGLGEDISTNVLPKVKELQEQNKELVKMLERVNGKSEIYEYGLREELEELLTKYQKPTNPL